MPAGPLFGTPHKRQTPGACLFFMPAQDPRALHKGEIFMEKIGMIGLGIMGCPIAKNLCAAGADLTVFGPAAGGAAEGPGRQHRLLR